MTDGPDGSDRPASSDDDATRAMPDAPDRPSAPDTPPAGERIPPPPPPPPGFAAPGAPYGPAAGTPQDEPPASPYGTPPAQPGGSPYASPAYGTPSADQGQDQYGQPQFGHAQYGQPAYGTPTGYGYAAPARPPLSPEANGVRNQAIIALVCNATLVLLTCFLALPSIGGIVTSSIALGRVGTDVPGARRLVKWSWGLLAASVALGILAIISIVALFASSTTY